jgi:hypothetical protein
MTLCLCILTVAKKKERLKFGEFDIIEGCHFESHKFSLNRKQLTDTLSPNPIKKFRLKFLHSDILRKEFPRQFPQFLRPNQMTCCNESYDD